MNDGRVCIICHMPTVNIEQCLCANRATQKMKRKKDHFSIQINNSPKFYYIFSLPYPNQINHQSKATSTPVLTVPFHPRAHSIANKQIGISLRSVQQRSTCGAQKPQNVRHSTKAYIFLLLLLFDLKLTRVTITILQLH